MSILAGLNMSVVSRLKSAWQLLPDKYTSLLKHLDELMSSKNNYKMYRSELSKSRKMARSDNPPILPYLGVYLRDLTKPLPKMGC